jgi:hypothetical protein
VTQASTKRKEMARASPDYCQGRRATALSDSALRLHSCPVVLNLTSNIALPYAAFSMSCQVQPQH